MSYTVYFFSDKTTITTDTLPFLSHIEMVKMMRFTSNFEFDMIIVPHRSDSDQPVTEMLFCTLLVVAFGLAELKT